MKSTEQLEQTPSVYKDRYNDWVNKYLAEDKAKCISSNPALFVCVDKSCILKQPFICSSRSCCCMKDHRKCTNMNLDYLLEVFKKDKPHIEAITKKLSQRIDDLIDKLSEIKENIVQQLQKGKANHLFQEDKQMESSGVNELLKSEFLTGSLIQKIVTVINQGKREKVESTVLDQIVGNHKLLENKGIHMFSQNLMNFLFDKKVQEKFCWDKNLSYSEITINNKSVSFNKNYSQVQLGLLSPALTSLKGRYVKWRLKIACTNLSSTYIGIILRDLHKQHKKQFASTEQITKSYLINQSGKTYAHNNAAQNYKEKSGITFQAQDVVELQLDKVEWVLKFKNLRSLTRSQLTITQVPALQLQSCHICVGFLSNGKEVQIFSPIETSFKNYQF